MARNTGRGSASRGAPKRLPVGKLPSLHWVSSKQAALDAALSYRLDGRSFVVPRGFVTDFATVPRIFWWMFGPTGLYTWAAILHDWFCKMLRMRKSPVTAREADRYFRLACAELGVGFVPRWLLWTGVRWGALGTPSRRPGWWRDAPLVAVWSVLVIVPVIVATVGVLFALAWVAILSGIARVFRLR